MTFIKRTFCFVWGISVLSGQAVCAQNAAPTTQPQFPQTQSPINSEQLGILANTLAPEVLVLKHIEQELKEKYKKEIYTPPAVQSLFFNPTEQALLREARSGFNTNVMDDGSSIVEEDEKLALQKDAPANETSFTERALSLGGIVFSTPDDWTIWLNRRRITSANLPKEAIDLRVYKDFIELKWFDGKNNKIFPIRLRPNQTFNLDAQTFVPG